MVAMKKHSVIEIFRNNVEALEKRADPSSTDRRGVASRTIASWKSQERPKARLDSLEKAAAYYGVEPWMMLHPDLETFLKSDPNDAKELLQIYVKTSIDGRKMILQQAERESHFNPAT